MHAYSMHFETSHKVGKRMKRALLASRDRALLYVACRCVVAVYVRDSPLGDTTFAAMQIDQPFLAPRKAEVKQLLAETFVAQRRRIDGLESATPSDLARVRDELETQLGIRDRRPAP